MIVGAGVFDLHLLDEPGSLKEKRHVVRGLRDRIRSRLEVSVAEVGNHDLWQRATLGVAFAASDSGIAEKLMAGVRAIIGGCHGVEVIGEDVELINF